MTTCSECRASQSGVQVDRGASSRDPALVVEGARGSRGRRRRACLGVPVGCRAHCAARSAVAACGRAVAGDDGEQASRRTARKGTDRHTVSTEHRGRAVDSCAHSVGMYACGREALWVRRVENQLQPSQVVRRRLRKIDQVATCVTLSSSPAPILALHLASAALQTLLLFTLSPACSAARCLGLRTAPVLRSPPCSSPPKHLG